MRKFVSILCLALIFVSYLFVVSSGNRPIRISFSYPTFRFGRISGTVSGIFKDYYAFVKDVSFIDASIYGCHINGTDGSITFSGNITVNISVISSANNLTLIFNNAIVYLQNTFIYARNLRIVLKNSTILFLDDVSYMHARNFYLYIVESTSRYIGNFRFIGWNSTIIFDHVKNSSMDITNRVSFGIVTYYSGSRLILMNSSINISSYYGAELDIIANSSSVSISNIYDDVKWLDINIDAVSTRITITQSLFNHLSLVRMLDSKLYLDNTVVTGSLNLYSYLDAVELGENVTENGLKVELIGNKDNVSLNDTSNKVIYTYNISTMNIRNAILRKLVMYKVRKVEISDSNIKNLVINNFEDFFIHNSRINKLSLLEGSQVVMNKVYNNQFKARDVFNVSVLDTYMSYVDIYSINNLILRNFYLRSITVDTEHGKWAIIPGMRLALIESLDLYSVWISSKPENDSEGRIHYEYSDALIFQSIINTHMVQFYANISYVKINTYNFYAYEVHFSFDTLLLQGKLDFVSIEKTTFNGQDVIYLEGASDMQIVDKSVVAIASSRLFIANSKFVYVYQSKNITVNSASYIYAYMSQNIFVTNSNIKSGHIFGSANIIVNNTSFSWYFDIENSFNVNLFNVVLNSSFIVVEKSRLISFRNVGFYYSSDMYLPFIRYRTSILLFLTDHIVLEDLYSAGKSEHSTIAVYIYNSRYVTVRNIALGSSSIYIYVGFSYMVSIKNFENFGKYSGVSVVYTDFFLLDAETSESLYFAYFYGA